MRTVFGIMSTAAALGSGILASQPGAGLTSFSSLAPTVAFILLTLVLGRYAAASWEHMAVRRHAEWLRAAEAAKYRVTPISQAPNGP